jgi:hypothetical protein
MMVLDKIFWKKLPRRLLGQNQGAKFAARKSIRPKLAQSLGLFPS